MHLFVKEQDSKFEALKKQQDAKVNRLKHQQDTKLNALRDYYGERISKLGHQLCVFQQMAIVQTTVSDLEARLSKEDSIKIARAKTEADALETPFALQGRALTSSSSTFQGSHSASFSDSPLSLSDLKVNASSSPDDRFDRLEAQYKK